MPAGTRARIRCTIAVWEPRLGDRLRTWLSTSSDVELLESPAAPDQLQRSLHQHQPDVVLLAAPQDQAALLVVHQAAACGPGLGVLAVGEDVSAHVVRLAFAAGAHGFVTLNDGPDHLVAGVRDVHRSIRHVSPAAATVLLNAMLERPSQPLSGREIEVLALMARDVPVREISRRLAISSKTIDSHKQSIFRKLDVHTQRDAVLRGYELGFIRNIDAPPDGPEAPVA